MPPRASLEGGYRKDKCNACVHVRDACGVSRIHVLVFPVSRINVVVFPLGGLYIVNTTYGTLKNLYIYLFLLTIFGPIYCCPPVIG